MNNNPMRVSQVLILAFALMLFASCSTQRQISKQANTAILNNTDFGPAHVGISVFDPEANKFLYNYQSEKYFTPASNTKLFSLYAALKYLGDSLVAARYTIDGDALVIQATGDPTFLHPDYKNQRLFDFMMQPQFKTIELYKSFSSNPLGKGWAWDDFTEEYMAERDPFPMYGNIATFTFNGDTLTTMPPRLAVAGMPVKDQPWSVNRFLGGHFFSVNNTRGTMARQKAVTLAMERGAFAYRFLSDTLHKEVVDIDTAIPLNKLIAFHSQPADSFYSLMMHRSDNFFAEQTLMMVSNEKLGIMSDTKIIDTILKVELKDLPQKPRWADGSGLSRYNLFSPNDFIWLLNKMKDEYGLERLKVILPTGNTGTLKGLYQNYAGRIYAKTGTLSNVVALSGYLLTKKNKTLIFSVLVNNHVTSATAIRKSIEQFLTGLIEKY